MHVAGSFRPTAKQGNTYKKEKKSMKTIIAVTMMLSLMMVSGCRSTVSPQGGIKQQDREFTITVPTYTTIKQGESAPINLSLNRGPYFKRDVQLDITSDGLSVMPAGILVKASEKPEAQLQIAVARDAALGEYRVYVKGTPTTGKTTSTEFTVKVVTP
jgi:hypothetical protein